VAPPSRRTDGDLAAFLSSSYGLTPDEWQQLVLDDWLAQRADDRWSALTCGLAVPRQNGKNGVIEMRELYGMVALGEKFLHTAHEVKTARKAFLRLAAFFENERRYPELAAMVAEGGIRRTNGQEAIVLTNGGSVEFVARSKGSGRGFTVDVLVMDEAQELSDDALEALMPTTSAAPQGNPQWIFTGTPPGPAANGEVFTRTRDDALGGNSIRLAWHEWSVDGDVDLDDRANWFVTNPALGGRLQLDVLEGERARFSDDGFARERLGRWSLSDTAAKLFPAWDDRVAPGPGDDVSPNGMAVDMSHSRVLAVAGCWVTEGARHVELLALDQVTDLNSAAPWIAERAGRKVPVVIDTASPAAPLIPVLEGLKVHVIASAGEGADMAKACGGLYDDYLAGVLTHAGQPQMDDAVAGVKKRLIGKAGGFGFDRSDPSVNIAPFVAAALARFGAVSGGKPPSKSYAF